MYKYRVPQALNGPVLLYSEASFRGQQARDEPW